MKVFVFLAVLAPFLASYAIEGEKTKSKQLGVEEVSPTEDLMREHGILNRILLIYEEIIRRIDSGKEFSIANLEKSAQIIRNFIENYHEKLEEDYIFTRMEKAGKLQDLTKVLREQHQRGRQLTDFILVSANKKTFSNPNDRLEIKAALEEFIKMYRPHEAREDTVLFPAFKELITQEEYEKLGDLFEDKEHELFGENGFESTVDQVAALEKELGIYDLSKFTPAPKYMPIMPLKK